MNKKLILYTKILSPKIIRIRGILVCASFVLFLVTTIVLPAYAQEVLEDDSSEITKDWKTFTHSRDKYSVRYPGVEVSGMPDKKGSSELDAYDFRGSLSFQRFGGWADIYLYEGSLDEAVRAVKKIDSSNRIYIATSSITIGGKQGIMFEWRHRLSTKSNINRFYMVEYQHDRTLRISGPDTFVQTIKFLDGKVVSQKKSTKINAKIKDLNTKIDFISPKESETKVLEEPINIALKYNNAPQNTQIVYSVSLIKASASSRVSMIGGGSGASLKPLKKKGTEKYVWKTGLSGSGYLDTPGKYIVEASIRDCHPLGCHMNAQFPGLNLPIKTYATATPVTITIKDKVSKDDKTKQGVVLLSPNVGSYKIGDRMTITWQNNGLPKGSTVCAHLQNTSNKIFTFIADEDNCVDSVLVNKIGAVSGTLIRNSGYALNPGKYRVYLLVTTPLDIPVSAGKETGKMTTVVGDWFDIR